MGTNMITRMLSQTTEIASVFLTLNIDVTIKSDCGEDFMAGDMEKMGSALEHMMLLPSSGRKGLPNV